MAHIFRLFLAREISFADFFSSLFLQKDYLLHGMPVWESGEGGIVEEILMEKKDTSKNWFKRPFRVIAEPPG